MAKGEAAKTNQMIQNQTNASNARFNPYIDATNAALTGATQQDAATRAGINTGYTRYLSDPSFSGFDPNATKPLYQSADSYSDLGKDWGSLGSDWGAFGADPISAANQKGILGNGVFSEFANTGGLTDANRADFRARSNSVIPSMYDALRQRLTAGNTAAGGFNPGFDSQMSKLTRQEGQGAADAARGTEVDLTDLINKGREWGASGLSSASSDLAKIINQAKEAALTGRGGALTGAGTALAGKNASILGALDYMLKGGQGNLAALKGQTDLYGTAPGLSGMYNTQYLKALGLSDEDITNLINQQRQNNPNISPWDRLTQILGAAAGGAKAFAGGGGAGAASNNWNPSAPHYLQDE